MDYLGTKTTRLSMLAGLMLGILMLAALPACNKSSKSATNPVGKHEARVIQFAREIAGREELIPTQLVLDFQPASAPANAETGARTYTIDFADQAAMDNFVSCFKGLGWYRIEVVPERGSSFALVGATEDSALEFWNYGPGGKGVQALFSYYKFSDGSKLSDFERKVRKK